MAVAHATPEGPLKTYERFLGPIDRSEEGGRVLMGDDAAPRRAMGSRSGRAGGRAGILEGGRRRRLESVLIGTGDAQLPDTNELGND